MSSMHLNNLNRFYQELDPFLFLQWYLFKSNVPKAWGKYGQGSDTINIAILDLDFQIDHPDYKDKVIASKDFDLNTTFILNGQRVTVTEPFQVVYDSTHGTAVASLAAAAQNNQGIMGAAPNVNLILVRPSMGTDDAWIESFQYAIDAGAQVIVCSLGYNLFGGNLSNKMKSALTDLSKDAVFCFASGNDGAETFGFANHPDVIGVGASTIFDQLANYSNTGEHISIVAPSDGEGLRVIAADFTGVEGSTTGNVDFTFGGTSAACPIVGGIVALMLSANPHLTTSEVKQILASTGKAIDNKHIRVDAYEAVKEATNRADNAFNEFKSYIDSLNLRYFEAHEFWVKGNSHNNPNSPAYGLNTNPPRDKWENIGTTAKVLDEFRHRIDAPVVIISAYRSPAYNNAIAGAAQSQHLEFRAIDFTVRNTTTPVDWAEVLRAIRSEGMFRGGIGVYNSFIHLDTRGENRDW